MFVALVLHYLTPRLRLNMIEASRTYIRSTAAKGYSNGSKREPTTALEKAGFQRPSLHVGLLAP